MRSLFGLLLVAFVFIVGGVYSYRRMQQVPLIAPAVPPKPSENPKDYAEAKQAAQAVTMVGPLAEYMAKQEGGPRPSEAKEVETVTWIPTASDHVGGSVVGSTAPILRKSFTVRSAVQVAFQVPAHAASPRLRGTFHSSATPGGGGAGCGGTNGRCVCCRICASATYARCVYIRACGTNAGGFRVFAGHAGVYNTPI